MESESCTSPRTANTPCGAVPLRVMPATWYPWRTRRSAIASPMPRLAPVTTAVRAVCSLNAPLLTFGCCHTLARIAMAVLTTATSREGAAGYPACACERSPTCSRALDQVPASGARTPGRGDSGLLSGVGWRSAGGSFDHHCRALAQRADPREDQALPDHHGDPYGLFRRGDLRAGGVGAAAVPGTGRAAAGLRGPGGHRRWRLAARGGRVHRPGRAADHPAAG